MAGLWKVPFRDVYCTTFGGMLKQTLWCHVVLRAFPDVIDVGSCGNDLLLDGQSFLTQHREWFERVARRRSLALTPSAE